MVARITPIIESQAALTATGERFIPDHMTGDIELEHVHRYRFASQLVAKKSVLDIASGEGYGSAFLSQTAKHVFGVDISAEAVGSAKQKYQRRNLDFLTGSCTEIPLGDATIDVIVSFETIEHHAEHEAMMRELLRVLRPRGLLLISTPDKLEYSDKPAFRNPFHVKELYREEFQSLLEAHFSNVQMFGQRVLTASALISERSEQGVLFSDLSADAIPQLQLPSPKYLLAVASNGRIPTIRAHLLERDPTTRQPELKQQDAARLALMLRAISTIDSPSLKNRLNGAWYLETNPDLVTQGVDPYAHWMQHGAAEGRLPAANIEDLARELIAEREGKLRSQIAAREHALRRAQEEALERQRDQALQVERVTLKAREEVGETLRILAERERTVTDQLLSQQKLAGDQQDTQRRATEARLRDAEGKHHERENALTSRATELERRLQHLHDEANERQRTLESQFERALAGACAEIGSLRQTIADRERATADQLLQQQRSHEDERERLRVSVTHQIQTLSTQHHDREQTLLATIADKDLDIRTIQRDSSEQRKELEAVVGQTKVATQHALDAQRAGINQRLPLLHTQHRDEIERQLRAMVERERMFGADILGIRDMLAEERRLLRAQYAAIVRYVYHAIIELPRRRPWWRSGVSPLLVDSLWTSTRESAHFLHDSTSLRGPAQGEPNQANAGDPEVAPTSGETDLRDIPPEPQVPIATYEESGLRTIKELLEKEGHDFIACAYLTLLGRKPDLESYMWHMDQLRQHGDQGAIIRHICDTREAKRRPIRLKGLRLFLWAQKWKSALGSGVGKRERASPENRLRVVLEEIEHDIDMMEKGILSRLAGFGAGKLPGAVEQLNALIKSFDAVKYVKANPDVGASGLNAYEHFLRFGWFENRRWAGRSP